MGKINGINSDLSGQVGNIVYRNTKKGVVVAQAPRKASTPRRSEKQMYLRCQLGNVAANYRLYEGKLAQAFEDKTAAQSEFNLMVQVNYGITPVFITKQERLNGACVVSPYQFCRGSLKSIGMDVQESGVVVTDIALGDLVIDNNTTVAEFTAAVLRNNTGWEDTLDQITFFLAKQYHDPVSLTPRASMDAWKVVLDLSDETPLRSMVSALGFTTVGGYLGTGMVLQNMGCAYVHSRQKGDGSIKVGSQRLVVVSDILAYYQSGTAMKASADSYGGINTKAVYLDPASSLSYSSGVVLPSASGTSSSSGSGSGTGSSSGTSEGSGTEGTGSSGSGTDNSGGGPGSGDNTGGGGDGGDDDDVEGTGGDE